MPSPIGGSLELSLYLQPFLKYPISRVSVLGLTFQGHVTS